MPHDEDEHEIIARMAREAGDASFQRLQEKIEAAKLSEERRTKMDQNIQSLLTDILEYMEQREDVRDGDEGRQFPNTEMAFAQQLRRILGEPPTADEMPPLPFHDSLTPNEQRWFDGLAPELQHIVEKHGTTLYHFTLNRAALAEDLRALSQLIRSHDAQERIGRMLQAANMLIALAFRATGATDAQHQECLRDIDTVIALRGPQASSKIIVPTRH